MKNLLYPQMGELKKRLKWYGVVLCCCAIGYAGYQWGHELWYKACLSINRTEIWIANEGLKVGPYQRPIKTSICNANREILLHAARGEHVAFQIVLASATDANGTIRVTSSTDKTTPHPMFSFHTEYYVTPKHLYRLGSTGAGEYPDPLLPGDDAFSLSSYRNTVIWVEAKIPETFSATEWSETLTVAMGSTTTTLPVRVKVWRFQLPSVSHLAAYAEMYPGRFADGEKVTPSTKDPTFINLCRRYNEIAKEHRLVLGWRRINPDTEFDEKTGKLLSIDWTAYDALFSDMLEANPTCWRAPIDENWRIQQTSADKRAIREYVRAIEQHFEEKGWPVDQTIAYIYDEPEYWLLKSISTYGQVFDEGSTRLRFFVATYPDETLRNVDDYAPLASDCYPPELAPIRAGGARVWFYQTEAEPHLPLEYIHTYATAFRLWPWIAWRYKIDGVFFWAANFWTDEPYKTIDAYYGNGEGVLFYPGAKLNQIGQTPTQQPIPSYRLKMLRRGLEDYEYLWLIAKHFGKEKADAFAQRIVRSALCVTYNKDGGFAGYWGKGSRYYSPSGSKYAYGLEDPRGSVGEWETDPECFTAIRREMGELLDSTRR